MPTCLATNDACRNLRTKLPDIGARTSAARNLPPTCAARTCCGDALHPKGHEDEGIGPHPHPLALRHLAITECQIALKVTRTARRWAREGAVVAMNTGKDTRGRDLDKVDQLLNFPGDGQR